ncbi:MAG TPA: hypothetical protein PKY30_10345 [Myxococcota bacterium]|nr:hypothetical protein [Myxococcota bacterium]HNH47429.1 hypothetical protein [Myxococcota bacterium]
MARLRFDALLDFVEHQGEVAFLGELRRMGMRPSSVVLCEGELEAEEALTYAVTLRGLGWEGQAQEVVEAVVEAAMVRRPSTYVEVYAEA